MYLYIYLANLLYYFILYQYMYITLNVYIDLYIVQHHRILLYKYGAIEIKKHLHLHLHCRQCVIEIVSTVI